MVPGTIPVMIPVAVPIVATDGVLLVHVPPPASVSAVVRPIHTVAVPSIGVGSGLTVNASVEIQPVDNI